MKKVFEQDKKANSVAKQQGFTEMQKDIEEHIKQQIALKIRDLFKNSDKFVKVFSKNNEEEERSNTIQAD